MTYGLYNTSEIEALVDSLTSEASGVLIDASPAPYTTTDFAVFYPQFSSVVPLAVLQAYITLAGAVVQQARFHDAWSTAMAAFIAHFCTLYLRATPSGAATSGQVLAMGEAHGLKTSKSAGGVSVSIDFDAVGRDLDGWASFKETEFGRLYATLASMHTTGTMVV